MVKQSAQVMNDYPLITLAVAAYNQQRYIRETIEAAFAQTYQPLEIILSDDFSTDRTFDIIQQMAANYSGPHTVVAIRQKRNAGIVNHLINIAQLARGDLLVMNAGDDLSHPDRVASLQRAWHETGATALSSWHDEIAEDGSVLRTNCSFPPSADTQRLFAYSQSARRIDGEVQAVPGCCAAYERSFWAGLPPPRHKLLVEDGLATILINLRGEKIYRVKQSLLAYRILPDSASIRNTAATTQQTMKREAKVSLIGADVARMIEYVFQVVPEWDQSVDPGVIRTLQDHRNYGRITEGLWSERPLARFKRLFWVRSTRDLKFLLPRLFGVHAFVMLKKLYEKMRAARRKSVRGDHTSVESAAS